MSTLGTQISEKQDENLYFQNVSVTDWASDATYPSYSYKATVALSGVASSDVAEIVFSIDDATSGNYAPICQTYDGGVYIWGKTNTVTTISTIIIYRGA